MTQVEREHRMNTPRFNVLIIGGGFSGTLLAVQLLYRAPALKIGILDNGMLPVVAWLTAPPTSAICLIFRPTR